MATVAPEELIDNFALAPLFAVDFGHFAATSDSLDSFVLVVVDLCIGWMDCNRTRRRRRRRLVVNLHSHLGRWCRIVEEAPPDIERCCKDREKNHCHRFGLNRRAIQLTEYNCNCAAAGVGLEHIGLDIVHIRWPLDNSVVVVVVVEMIATAKIGPPYCS